MFGTNPVTGPAAFAGRYRVQEVFPTLQGEGPLAGTPAVFVRFANCNLACTFCDTDFTSSKWEPDVDELYAAVRKAAGTAIKLIVFTGGEPLLQDPRPIIEALLADGFAFQFETAGTIWPAGLEAYEEHFTIVCSPKTQRVHFRVAQYCRDWKYIMRYGDSTQNGIPVTNTQDPTGVARRLFVPPQDPSRCDTVWLQPCEEYDADGNRDVAMTVRNTKRCVTMCLEHGYRLSLQTHKILGLP